MGKQRLRKPLDRDELISLLRSQLPRLRERFGVRTLGLFGSYARGAARSGSDVDLLVEFDRTPGLLSLIELEQDLSDLLGVKVDLVMKSDLRPTFWPRVMRELQAL